MKVFFSSSRRGRQYFDHYFWMISKYLDKMGYENINSELMDTNNKEFFKEMEESGPKFFSKTYQSLIKKVIVSDIAIFECSLHSLSIGFLIEKALELNKPVIVLYLKEHLPDFLAGIQDEKFQIVEYSEENLEEKLSNAILKARNLMEKRFNFFISPTLLTYLNKAAKENGITKSTFIRNLILDDMKKSQM